MDLRTYIESTETPIADFARMLSERYALKVSRDMVYQWVKGIRPIPTEYGWPIECETGGAVTRREMFPSKWMHIWPELRQPVREEKRSIRCQ